MKKVLCILLAFVSLSAQMSMGIVTASSETFNTKINGKTYTFTEGDNVGGHYSAGCVVEAGKTTWTSTNQDSGHYCCFNNATELYKSWWGSAPDHHYDNFLWDVPETPNTTDNIKKWLSVSEPGSRVTIGNTYGNYNGHTVIYLGVDPSDSNYMWIINTNGHGYGLNPVEKVSWSYLPNYLGYSKIISIQWPGAASEYNKRMEPHTHSYSTISSTHPHYGVCSCGATDGIEHLGQSYCKDCNLPSQPTGLSVSHNTVTEDTCFTWNPTTNTTSYDIRIFKESGESVTSIWSQTKPYCIYRLGSPGKYYFTVAAVNSNFDSCWNFSSEYHFTVADALYFPVASVTSNGHVYEVYKEYLSWNEAKKVCESKGGHLVTITSAEENDLVKNLIKWGSQNDYWIGAYCTKDNMRMRWVTNEAWTYSNWNKNEPNNDLGEEFYGEITKSDGWNDLPDYTRDRSVGFVLEKELPHMILTVGSKNATVFGRNTENDVAPVIRNNHTMLPIRFIAEALGTTVNWNSENRTVQIIKGNKAIEITIDNDVAIVNGIAKTLDSPAFIEDDRTFLPIRFVSENLGANVEWVEGCRQVIITRIE